MRAVSYKMLLRLDTVHNICQLNAQHQQMHNRFQPPLPYVLPKAFHCSHTQTHTHTHTHTSDMLKSFMLKTLAK